MKIAKCPWCGSGAVKANYALAVVCQNDDCVAWGPNELTPDAAVADWNRVSEAVWGKEEAYE